MGEQVKIGIGVCTYNRLELLKQSVEKIKSNTKVVHRLIVASDGSTDGTNDWLIQNRVPCILGPNEGMHHNKNRLLTALQDCDYLFILDDDIFPKTSRWIECYLNGFECSGYNFFSYKTGRVSKLKQVPYSKCTITLSHGLNGCLLMFTKKILEVCGGFNLEYKGYGYGTIEFGMRILQAKLAHPELYADVLEGRLNMEFVSHSYSTTTGQRKTNKQKQAVEKAKQENKMRFKRFRRSFRLNPEQYRYREFRVPIEIIGG